ncbi:hypothetical protein EJB05_23027, partial [Eragrostis curvula]
MDYPLATPLLNIAIECAEALWCMHSMYRPVLHGDIKPDNILMDDNFHAKVSDFGLARLLSAGGNTDRATIVKGSIGYMDPTFKEEGCLSPKVDVYSLGVVLVSKICSILCKNEDIKRVQKKTGGRRDTNNIATRSSLTEPNSQKNAGDITVFTNKEIWKITQNFKTSICTKFDSIYLGALPDNTIVAVKKLRTGKEELTIHSQMQHSNIVKVVGCCLRSMCPFLVTEYVPNGSLGEYLLVKARGAGKPTAKRNDGRRLLDLNTCYQIAQGVASAMAYLHKGRQEWVLHCDIKPENILLDNDFRPKICDFGLSR